MGQAMTEKWRYGDAWERFPIDLNKRRLAHLLDFYSRNGFTPEVA